MSLMTAGKQISLGGNQAYGRGLFIIDQDEAERKAKKQLLYQEELKVQMQEARRRKEQEKRKQREEDMRLEKKFYEEVQKEKQNKKNQKPTNSNNQNVSPLQTSQMAKSEYMKDPPKAISSPQEQHYEFDFRNKTEGDREENPYISHRLNPNPYDMEQQRFYEESSNQKLRSLKEALQEKIGEVYRRIKGSTDLEVDKELQHIRKKINSYNQGYESENPRVEHIDQGFSQFYQIPTKKNYYQYQSMPKRDNSNKVRSQYPLGGIGDSLEEVSRGRQTRLLGSRADESRGGGRRASKFRQSRSSNDTGWGRKRGKDNFLGNREALDYKIESMLGNIDNILSGSEPY